ncbi:MAG: hypothetical protein K0R92_2751 [Lachnospiraceae bacterium]|nr:hypothetical protein [Lachnospiraceae bacterium]
MKTIAIIGSCDTKYKEIAFMRQFIEDRGLKALVINIATGPDQSFGYDISREEVAEAFGTSWSELEPMSKGEKIEFMAEAAPNIVMQLYQNNKIDGVLSVGGLQNTVVATAAMRKLPIGFPKVMASTVASGKRSFDSVVGSTDIVVIPSICDFTGLNIVTRQIISNACSCCIGMVQNAGQILRKGNKPVVAVSLMGITNTGACAAIEELERLGIETIGFHTTGVGGALMEQMAEDSLVDGILDLTIHEITSEYFGGGFSYSDNIKNRLLKSTANRIALVVSVGGLDFVDYLIHEFPPRMDERIYMMHNATAAHIKILPDEAKEIANIVVKRLSKVDYPIKILLPTDGMRHNTRHGEELYDKEVDDILVNTIRSIENKNVEIVTIPGNLDTKEWGIQAAHHMIDELKLRNKINIDIIY